MAIMIVEIYVQVQIPTGEELIILVATTRAITSANRNEQRDLYKAT
jgi:hypothetical protein